MQYRERRQPIRREGDLYIGDRRHRVRIFDISSGGAQVKIENTTVQPGVRIALTCGKISCAGSVAWRKGSRHGIRFDTPLTAVDLKELVGHRTRTGMRGSPGSRGRGTSLHGFAEL